MPTYRKQTGKDLMKHGGRIVVRRAFKIGSGEIKENYSDLVSEWNY